MDSSALRVLLVEDNLTDVLLLEEALEEIAATSIVLTHVSRLDEALQRLSASRFDAVLLDLGLPDSHGLETFARMQEQHPDVAILVLSGLDNDALATRAVQEGAQDYLVKGRINGVMLTRTLRYAIERKRSMAAEQESQRFLQATLDALVAHIAVLDENGTIIAINKAWRSSYEQNGGDPRSCGVGANYIEVCQRAESLHSPGASSMVGGIRDVMTGKRTEFSLEYVCGVEWFVARVTRFTSEGPVRVVVAHQNITERKQAEESLQRNETKFRTIFETAHEAILLTNDDGTYVDANPAACVLLGLPCEGLPCEELLGRNVADFVSPSTRESVATQFTAFLREQHQEGEFAICRPDGSLRHAEYRAVANLLPGTHMVVLRDVTERKRAKEEQEAKTREIITVWESMTDAFFAVDTQWRFTHVNSQAEILLRRTRDELLGKDIWDEFSLPPTSTISQQYRRAVEEQIMVDFEVFYAPFDGWFEVHAYPSPFGLSVYFRDITERKRAEQELRDSEARFQSIVTNVPGMVYQFVIHSDGAVEWPFVSEGCRDIYEMEPEEIRLNPTALLERVHPDDRALFDSSVAESAKNLSSWNWAGRMKAPSGKISWVQANSRPRRLPDGGTLWDGLLVDITARKEAEEERDRFFTMSLDMLAIANFNGYFTRLNPAFEATLGFSLDEIMARPFMEWVHPDDIDATRATMARLNAGEKVLRFENRYRCRDGSYKWLRWMCAPFGETLYAVAHDITPVKRAEAALLKANDELELRVMERTAELEVSNQEMRLAKQEADAANLAKSEFLSRMSHELRTPLNAILGFGQILDKPGLTPIQEESVHYILKGGRHLLDLINEVLDISRVEAGHIELSIEPIALADLVPQCCALLKPLADARAVRLEESASGLEHSHILADHQRIKQVLLNLLSNAIKYNRPGGRVEVACRQSAQGRIRISVHDTGMGIAPEDLSRLFTPFERLHAKDSEVEGTGLGLVLSQRLAKAMGGTLEVESVPGKGSTFSMEFPQVISPEQRLRETPTSIFEANVERTSQREYSVLCIEDNLSNLRLMEVILETRPEITLLAAMQGSVGLDLARQHEPDVILLDLNLPDMHGREVLKRLQQSALTRDIPVIIISADATRPQVERLLDAGANLYLTKPLNVTEFLQAINTLLQVKEALEAKLCEVEDAK